MRTSVLLIGDTHLPYEHSDYLPFCIEVSNKYKCGMHIHVGDYEDQHAISFHDTDVDLYSAGHELELVIEKTRNWEEAFPKMKTLDSNHGSLVMRRFKRHGIPMRHLKTIDEVYETKKWKWYEDIVLRTKMGQVYLTHGKTTAYQKLAREVGISAVQGHFHGKCEITWCNSVFHERFNMFVGCGVNRQSLAMAYGKVNIPQPIIACGVLNHNGYPFIEKMPFDKHGRWTGKLFSD